MEALLITVLLVSNVSFLFTQIYQGLKDQEIDAQRKGFVQSHTAHEPWGA